MAGSNNKKSANLAAAIAAFSPPRGNPPRAGPSRRRNRKRPGGASRQAGKQPKGTNLSLRQSVDFWDAYGKTRAPPSSTSLGHFTTINGQVKMNMVVGTAARYLVYHWTPSGSKGFIYTYTPSPTSGALVPIEQIYTTQMGYDVTAVRPLRLSLHMANQSKFLEGSIDVLCLPEPLTMDLAFSGNNNITNTFAMAVENAVKIHQKSQNIPAKALSKKRFVLGPASFTGYNSYFDYPGGNASDQHIVGSKSYAMSTLIIRFNPVVGTLNDPNAQTYAIQAYCQDACRYPADHAFASHAAAQPVAKSTIMDTVNAMGSLVTEHGSFGHDVMETGIGAAVGRYGPTVAARAGFGEMFGIEAMMLAGLPLGV